MKQLWWRTPLFIMSWILFLALKIVTVLLGLVAVLFLGAYRDVLYDDLASWTRPWANQGDWYGGPYTFNETCLPRWWVVKLLPIYARWWHPILNALNVADWWKSFEPTDKKERGAKFGSYYKYHALRNPANGLRSYEWLDLDIEMDKVRYVTSGILYPYEPDVMRGRDSPLTTSWYLCWQGLQAGFKLIHLWSDKRHLVIKLGWRVQPQDATTPIPAGIRAEDAGFATKVLVYRKG